MLLIQSGKGLNMEEMPTLKVMDLAPRDDRELAFEFCKEYADILGEEVQVQNCGCMYVDEHIEGVHWDRVMIATCLKCEWKETLADSNYFTNTNLSLGGLR